MSMNMTLTLRLANEAIEIDLVQTPTDVSDSIVYDGKCKRNWKNIAMRYIKYVKANYAPHIVKEQRKVVGEAWATAEAGNGWLDFNVE